MEISSIIARVPVPETATEFMPLTLPPDVMVKVSPAPAYTLTMRPSAPLTAPAARLLKPTSPMVALPIPAPILSPTNTTCPERFMIGDLRFTKVIQLACLALLSAIGFHPSALFAQGSLTPPGPPGATMLTLSQIEPRTPISSGGFIITAPGSYCLTTNLVCTNTFGIETFANNITLDLNGFSLTGTSGAEF